MAFTDKKYLDSDGVTLLVKDYITKINNHSYTLSIASDSGTSALTLANNTKYKLTAGGNTFIFTTPNAAAASHNHAASNITSGTLDAARIPDLSGTYALKSHSHTDYAASGHTHTLSIATDTGTSALTLSSGGKYKLTAGGNTFIFTMGSFASSSHNHDGVYQPAGSYAAADHNHDSVYQAKGSYASSTHTHDLSIASDTGTASVTLGSGGKYKLTAGGKTYIFQMGSFAASDHTHSGYAASSHNHAASNITSGTFDAARIPDLSGTYAAKSHTHTTSLASDNGTSTVTLTSGGKFKLTTGGTSVIFTMGSFAASDHNHDGVYQAAGSYAPTIHYHSAGSITSGTLDAARIPDLSETYALKSHTHSYAASSHSHAASDITSGTLDAARIPNLSSTYSPVSHVHYSLSNSGNNWIRIGSGVTPTSTTPDGCVSIGKDNTVQSVANQAYGCCMIGYANIASGNANYGSTAIGRGCMAYGSGQVAVGSYNTAMSGPTFVVGAGDANTKKTVFYCNSSSVAIENGATLILSSTASTTNGAIWVV